MDDPFALSSSKKVKSLEVELQKELKVLKNEIEDAGLSQDTGGKGCR